MHHPRSRVGAVLVATAALLTACGATSVRSAPAALPSVPPLQLPSSPATSRATTAGPAADWPTYHRTPDRAGDTAGTPTPTALRPAWRTRLDGAVYAEPLVVGGLVVAATEGGSLYGLDRTSGRVVWRTHVGDPVPLARLPCGNVSPLGITGTPAYDQATGLVFAVAETTGPRHVLVGVDARTGVPRVRRLADPPGSHAEAEQQRSALAVSRGRVYVAYGGLAGDCGPYHGYVVASATTGAGPLLSYQVPTQREGGIWAPSGIAVDAAGSLYVAVGNGSATSGAWDHSDSVLRLSPDLALQDAFAPADWARQNAGDVDLGATGPLLLPDRLVLADGKSPTAYLLRRDRLGGVGGAAAVVHTCISFGGAARAGAVVVLPCVDGLLAVRLGPGPTLVAGWRAPAALTGSPVIAGTTVYSVTPGAGRLSALSLADGRLLATADVGATSRFATPTVTGRRVVIGTMTGVSAVTVG